MKTQEKEQALKTTAEKLLDELQPFFERQWLIRRKEKDRPGYSLCAIEKKPRSKKMARLAPGKTGARYREIAYIINRKKHLEIVARDPRIIQPTLAMLHPLAEEWNSARLSLESVLGFPEA